MYFGLFSVYHPVFTLLPTTALDRNNYQGNQQENLQVTVSMMEPSISWGWLNNLLAHKKC